MDYHPVADIFPMMSPNEFKQLVSDIATNGLREAIWLHPDGRIIDGRNRYRACLEAGTEPHFRTWDGSGSLVAFVVSANLHRRHLTQSQRAAVAVAALPMLEKEAKDRMVAGGIARHQGSAILHDLDIGRSDVKAGALFGVSGRMVSDAKMLEAEAPALFEEVKQGKKTIARAKREAKSERDLSELREAQANIAEAKRIEIESVCDLRVCSCAELFASGIRPDAVITDPPYPHEFLHCFTELAVGCASVGVPLVAVMSGQSYLPEVMQRLSEHLQYRWTLAYLTPGGQAVQQWQAKAINTWKPVLLFGDAAEWFGDVVVSKPNDNDKRFHRWGQSESGMADLVGRLTKPGQLICDPFLGGGTTAVVSLALGRRFVGCDIDPAHVIRAKERISA